jgi:hypothetical protein
MLLDPVSGLAFEMHASKGVFALLLGSGVSRSAKIPTGWDITLELVRRVAALKGSGSPSAPEAWYRSEFGEAPEYSKLLDTLATTPAQRQQLIRPFIEPDAGEIGRGEKQPTGAHRSVAKLMAKGYVRVVITTNFDRLLEQALAEVGVHAAVLSSPDQISGAVPLVHAGPTIIKVHGDYLDTRIRNTSGELGGYHRKLDSFLDRVLDEFGLIVCGWSAEWDVALRAAIDRAPSRRFPTYWAARTPATGAAAELITRRAARVVQISDADSFFDGLEQKVGALEAVNRPHPLSADLAVGMLKQYLPEPRDRIRLHDLVVGERNRVVKALDELRIDLNAFPDGLPAHAEAYESALGIALPLAYHAGIWSDNDQVRTWIDLISVLAVRSRDCAGVTVLLDLMMYPASLVMHAYLLGAVVGSRAREFGMLAGTVMDFGSRGGRMTIGDRLNASLLISHGGQDRFRIVGRDNDRRAAVSERMADLLRPVALVELGTDAAFDEAFARVELALSLGFAERMTGHLSGDDFWCPVGRYYQQSNTARQIIEGWKIDHANHGDNCAISVMAGLKRPPRFDEVLRGAHRYGWIG